MELARTRHTASAPVRQDPADRALSRAPGCAAGRWRAGMPPGANTAATSEPVIGSSRRTYGKVAYATPCPWRFGKGGLGLGVTGPGRSGDSGSRRVPRGRPAGVRPETIPATAAREDTLRQPVARYREHPCRGHRPRSGEPWTEWGIVGVGMSALVNAEQHGLFAQPGAARFERSVLRFV